MPQDPNPHISILDDPQTKRQIAEHTKRSLELAAALQRATITPEQLEAERWQAESNALAEENPLYAAARSASNHFLVLPLDGVNPLVRPVEATRDPWTLYQWWDRWPESNPGILLGRAGGAFAIRVQDGAAWERLRDMARVEMHDPDTSRTWREHRDIGGGLVRLVKPSTGRVLRSRVGWGKELKGWGRELDDRQIEGFWLLYSYPSIVSGQDFFDFRTKTIATGVKLLGDHATMPFSGSIVDGLRVESSMSGRPSEAPLWLAKRIGNARSRRVMTAEREGYEAGLRASEAHVIGEAEARRASAEAARRLALADQEKAQKALAKYEREAESEAG